MKRCLAALALLVLLAPAAGAAEPAPAQIGERVRAALAEAQFALPGQPEAAREAVERAAAAYDADFAATIAAADAEAAERIRDGLDRAARAADAADAAAFAAARAQVWTALLAGGYHVVEQALERGDAPRPSAGCSCASSVRRRAFRAPTPMQHWLSIGQSPASWRRLLPWRRCAPTCTTPTRRA